MTFSHSPGVQEVEYAICYRHIASLEQRERFSDALSYTLWVWFIVRFGVLFSRQRRDMSVENRIKVRRTPEECYIHTKVYKCLTHSTPKSTV